RRPDLPRQRAHRARRPGGRGAGRGRPRGAPHRHRDLRLRPVRRLAFPARRAEKFQRAFSAHPRARARRKRAGRAEPGAERGGGFRHQLHRRREPGNRVRADL
nr:hypothetical protein [Tanacetum cinerariifolium]